MWYLLIQGSFNIKLNSPVLTYSFGSDIIQHRIKGLILNGSYCNFKRKVYLDLTNFTLIYFAFKDHFIYIGEGSDGGTIIEIVAFYYLVARFNRHVKYHPVNC